jgi:hypothetical protein
MAMAAIEYEGQLRLQTDTCWIAGNIPQNPAAGGAFMQVPDVRPRINISQMLNEWAVLTSHHDGQPQATDLMFEQSSLDACPNTTAALQLAGNNGINQTFWPAPIGGGAAVRPATNGSVFLDTANPPVIMLKTPPYILQPGMLDLQLYSPSLQNDYINIVNRPDPAPIPSAATAAAHQAQQAIDVIALLFESGRTDMHQLIGEAFYFLKQIRNILGPSGWPKLAVEITGGKSRNYTRRKKRASAKRYK